MTATAAASTAAPEFKPIPTMIAERARERGSARAVVCEGRALSWTDFHGQVERVAAALAGLGLGKGDKVAILAPPSIDYVVSFMGILAAGACVVPLSTMAASEQLDMMLADSDSKALLLAASHKDLVLPREQALRLLVPGGRIAFDFDAPGWTRFADWLAAAPAHVPEPTIAPEDDFNLIYSSGTTGLPKGIMHSHRMRFGHVARGSNLGYGPDTVTLLSTPLYSNTTLVTLMPTLGWGGTAIVMPKFDVRRYLEIAERERVTHTMLVPVQYERILAHPDFDRFDLSSFRNKFSTSAPLRAPVKHDILKRWPGGMVEFYGLTEGGGTCILDAAAFPDKLHTVGKPAEGHDIRILDEQGKELPQGAVGEVVGRSPNMMTGYYKQPEKTREIYWHDADGNLFYKTGDLGRFDEDGFLVLLDRKKDMIISGGFNIYAADLEAVLSRHPDVLDVAVIGVPSRQWGETPLALVVRRPGSDVAADTLKEWANAQLGKGQRISAVEFRDHLPRSSIGKILKRELRQPYWAEAAPAR